MLSIHACFKIYLSTLVDKPEIDNSLSQKYFVKYISLSYVTGFQLIIVTEI